MHFLSKANNENNSHFLRSSRTARLLSVHTWRGHPDPWTEEHLLEMQVCRAPWWWQPVRMKQIRQTLFTVHDPQVPLVGGSDFSSWTSVCPVWLSLNLSGHLPDINSMLQILLLVSLMDFGHDLNSCTCWFTELCLCSSLPSSAMTGAPSVCVTQANSSTSVSHPTPPHLLGPSVHNSPLFCAAKRTLMNSPYQLTDMQQEKCHQGLKVRNKDWKQARRGGECHEKTGKTSFTLSLSLTHTHTQTHTTPLDSVPSLPSEHGLCLFSHFSSPFSPWIHSSHACAYHGNCYQVTNNLDDA